MIIDFKNQNVLITGATRGIGKAIADTFFKANANLILTGTKEEEINQLNQKYASNNCKYFTADFNCKNSTNNFLKTIEEYDKIDVCINNAGINIIDDFVNIKEEDFNKLLNVNLTAPFLINQAVSRKMKKHQYGRIVNIASIWSVITRPKRAIYTATKKALHGLTQTMSVELAEYNVLVNTISPGFTLTELTKQTNTPEEIKHLANAIPAKRMATPEEISKVVLFLASKENSYIVGQNIITDGGYVNV